MQFNTQNALTYHTKQIRMTMGQIKNPIDTKQKKKKKTIECDNERFCTQIALT